METNKLNSTQVKTELWHRGVLKWKCHKVQKDMYDIYYNSPASSILVWLISRQLGKSFMISILSIEQALRKPHAIIKVLTDTKLHAKTIYEKIFIEILDDCPSDLRPEYSQNQYMYKFKNGSQIQFAGSDGGHYERLRGQKASAIFVDEAGFCNNLSDIVESVLIPTTTHTGGRIVLSSTPSADMDHDFLKFVEKAAYDGTLTKKTIYDNPLLTKEKIDRIASQMGGVTSDRFRREYLIEIIKDSSISVIPEFTEELKQRIIKEWERPPFYETYTSMDLGFHDLTAILFAYYDFKADKVIIEDEYSVKGRDSQLPSILEKIKVMEKDIFTNPLTGEFIKPSLRVCDANPIIIQEINRASKGTISFIAPKKDDKSAALNTLRVMLENEKIIINPKCRSLIRHLENVKWKSINNKTEFGRSPDHSHYDFCDAILYIIRSIHYNKNPYPSHYNVKISDMYNRPLEVKNYNKENTDVYYQLFGLDKLKNKKKF